VAERICQTIVRRGLPIFLGGLFQDLDLAINAQNLRHLLLDGALWQAAKTGQSEIAEKYVNVTEAVREHHANNRLNGARRPRSLLSGLIFCGCCSGP
jgi:hypothetical protein